MRNVFFLKYFIINYVWNFVCIMKNPSMKNFSLLQIYNNKTKYYDFAPAIKCTH